MDKASTYIYVVIAHLGYGDDYSTKVVRAFTSKEDAMKCCERATMTAKFASGMYACYWNLMTDWSRENPQPDCDYNDPAYLAYCDKREAASNKFEDLLRFKERADIMGYSVPESEHLYYTFAEVPLDGNPYSGSQYMEKL